MRRGPIVVVLFLALCVGLAGVGVALRIPPTPRTVVLVTIDTLRADRVGAYGRAPTITPRLDALAASGAVFEQAWAVAPITAPSHATMLTGLLPSQHGLRTNRARRRLAPRDARAWSTLAETLRGAGCRTGAFVSSSVLRADRTGLDAGFDRYDDPPPARPGSIFESERRGEETVDAALAWVRGGEGPLFLWVHLMDPHAPYDAPQPWGAGPSHAADAAGYDGEVAYADACLGRLLDGLAAAGHGDAVVAVASDHGEGLGEHGESTHGFLLHEATLRVPLVIAAPGAVPAGSRRPEPVSTRDVAPTLLMLARVALPDAMPDTALFGRRREGPAPLYAESLYGHDAFRWAQTFAVRVGATKVVDCGPHVRVADLATDPGETSAAVGDAAAPPATPAGAAISTAAALELAREAARAEHSPGGTEAPSVEGGGYWGGGTDGGAVLPADLNRALPDPYDRVAGLRRLEAGQAALLGGAPARALEEFDAWAAADPANPQTQNWRGRALLAHRPARAAEAAAAFERSLELGWTSPECVEKSLQARFLAGDAAGAALGIEFAARARGRGVPDSGMAAALESALHLLRGDADGARKALDRARTFPWTPDLERAIRQTEDVLDGRGR